MYVYAQLGVSLPHYTVAQYSYPNSVYVPRSELQPGDLVFFAGLGHVGIYIGNDQFIHAPHTGTVVSIDSMTAGTRPSTTARSASWARPLARVKLFDLGREVILDHAAAQLEGRRHLAFFD